MLDDGLHPIHLRLFAIVVCQLLLAFLPVLLLWLWQFGRGFGRHVRLFLLGRRDGEDVLHSCL